MQDPFNPIITSQWHPHFCRQKCLNWWTMELDNGRTYSVTSLLEVSILWRYSWTCPVRFFLAWAVGRCSPHLLHMTLWHCHIHTFTQPHSLSVSLMSWWYKEYCYDEEVRVVHCIASRIPCPLISKSNNKVDPKFFRTLQNWLMWKVTFWYIQQYKGRRDGWEEGGRNSKENPSQCSSGDLLFIHPQLKKTLCTNYHW